MTIEGLVRLINVGIAGEPGCAEITLVRAEPENSMRLVLKTFMTEQEGAFEVLCRGVRAFQITRFSVERPEIGEAGIEGSGWPGAHNAYVVWVDSAVRWPLVIGSIIQRFDELPDCVTSYVRETLRFPNYRLPVIIPTHRAQEFEALMHELGVSYSLMSSQSETKGLSALRWITSFVVAEKFEVSLA